MTLTVGFVGWRGMVGSVLMQRLRDEDDFASIKPLFFSTSQQGQPAPDVGQGAGHLHDAGQLDKLAQCDAIVTCQGGAYSSQVYQPLRDIGWQGYWIDAASTLRMSDDAVIVLDPVNRAMIDRALAEGGKTFVGGNCTVSLMLLALQGLLQENLIEWVAPMTYQAASGAGAQNMRELLQQMGALHQAAAPLLADPAAAILTIDQAVAACSRSSALPAEHFGVPLAGSLIPWIDRTMPGGQSKEEWKAGVEANKILGTGERPIAVDGLCVRIGAMRCHAQALTIKLRQTIDLDSAAALLANANQWVQFVANERDASIHDLTPAKVTGSMAIPIGRLRRLAMGEHYLSAFTVGDQLLWGAAEPLRRMLAILTGRL